MRKHKPKRRFLFFFTLCTLLFSLFLLRHALLVSAVKIACHMLMPKTSGTTTSYDSVRYEEGEVVLFGMRVDMQGTELSIDETRLSFDFDLSRLFFEPRARLIHPQLTLSEVGTSSDALALLGALVPTRFYAFKLEAESGVLQFMTKAGSERLYFKLKAEEESELLGTFLLSYDPALFDLPVLSATLRQREEKLIVEMKMQQMQAARFLQLVNFFTPFPQKEGEVAEGEIELSGRALFALPFALQEIGCDFDISNLALASSELGLSLAASHFQGGFSYPAAGGGSAPLWKEIFAHASIKDGEGEWQADGLWEMKGISGELTLDPAHDPALDLKGTLQRKGSTYPLQLSGQGSVGEDHTFWLQLALQLAKSRALLSLCTPEKGSYIAEASVENLFEQEFELIQDALSFNAPFKIGKLEGKITSWTQGGSLQKIELENLLASDVRQNEGLFSATAVRLDAELDCKKLGQITSLRAHVNQGEMARCKNLEIDLEIAEGELKPSWALGSFMGVVGKVELHDYSIKKKGKRALLGSLLVGRDTIDFGLDLTDVPPLDKTLLTTEKKVAISECWVRSPKVDSAPFAPLLALIHKELKLEGEWDLTGSFNRERLLISLQGEKVALHHPDVQIVTSAIGDKAPHSSRALLVCDLNQKKWEVSVPLKKAKITLPNKQLTIEEVSGQLLIKEGELHLSAFSAEYKGNRLASAECSFLFDPLSLAFRSVHLNGALDCLSFPGQSFETELFLKEEEKISFDWVVSDQQSELFKWVGGAEKRGDLFHLFLDQAKSHLFGQDIKVSELVLTTDGQIASLDLQTKLSSQQLLRYGYLLTELPPLAFKGHLDTHLVYKGNKLIYDLSSRDLQLDQKKLSHFQLSGSKSGAIWRVEKGIADEMSFSGQCTLLTDRLALSAVEIDFAKHHLALDGTYTLSKQRFEGELLALSLNLSGAKLKGALKTRASSPLTFYKGPSGWMGESNCDLLIELSKPCPLEIQSAKRLKITFAEKEGFSLSGLQLIPSSLQGGESSFSCHVAAAKFNPRTSEGTLQNVQLSLAPAQIAALVKQKLLPKIAGSLRPHEALKGLLDVNFSATSVELQGELTEGTYFLFDMPWEIKQCKLRYSPNHFQIACKSAYNALPFFAHLQLSSEGAQTLGALTLKETLKQEGLKMLFKVKGEEQFNAESIQGSFCGLKAQISQQSRGLFGNLTIDTAPFCRLLSKEIQEKIKELQLGGQFELQGDFALFRKSGPLQFNGSLKAGSFAMAGFRLGPLQTQAEIRPDTLVLRQLQIDDEAGRLLVKQVRCEKEEGQWQIDAPLIQVRELRPSLLNKIGQEKTATKPLMIHDLTLNNLKGSLSNPQSLTCHGQMRFTNAFKKESHFLDVPLEMIKNFGLDFSLLTPVQGEITTYLEEGKFFINELVETYSEGKRSEFSLSAEDEPSYLDLNGNLFVNLKLKQNVVLKVAEPFTITVRGTWKKPKYGLR